jgi:hypothetical protein
VLGLAVGAADAPMSSCHSYSYNGFGMWNKTQAVQVITKSKAPRTEGKIHVGQAGHGHLSGEQKF